MQHFHNIVSIDLGSSSSKIAALTSSSRFEILVNQANFRETPSVIAFTNAQRLIGDQALIKMKSNFLNTVKAPQRYIGIANKMHLIEQEMKYLTVKYKTTPNNILFEVAQGSEVMCLSPQQLLTGLFTKFSQICILNNTLPDSLFITVQSYLTNGEKKAIKTCAEAANFKNVCLVEQWEAVLSEYFYLRQSDIESLIDEQIIIFIDFGYTNLAVHACIVGKNKLALIDQEYLRYSGAKNIDNLLMDFYVEIVRKQSGTDIRTLPKSLIKLQQAIENQRKKLSANKQSHLTIECLFGDYDLNYNMKREEFQNIAMPILAEFASAMQIIRSRVEPIAPIHSVEVIGGVSRVPFVSDIVKAIFNLEAGKKMNASESIARGAAIAGANRLGMLKSNTVNFVREVRSPILMYIHPLTQGAEPFLKNIELYSSSSTPNKPIFSKNSLIPSNTMTKIDSAHTQILIYKETNIGQKVLGYLQFSGPDTLTVLFDNDGILGARLMKGNFAVYDFGDILTIEEAKKLEQEQSKMKKRDWNIMHGYEIRNEFESLLYKTKQNITEQYKGFCNQQEETLIKEIVAEGEQWLNASSNYEIEEFNSRIETINMLMAPIKSRRAHKENLESLKNQYTQQVKTLSKLHKSQKIQDELNKIQTNLVELYNQQANSLWEGKYLSQQTFKDIIGAVKKLK